MFGQYSKPLHHPEPRHRDRRAGAITEVYERGMTAPGEVSAVGPVRPARERRQSRARLAARRAGRSWDPAPAVAATILALVLWVFLSAL